MESLLCFLRFVFIWGLTFSNIFGVLSSGMTSGAIEDASDITWAHAVNSREDLDKALSSSVDFLEADVSMGHVIGNERTPPTPVMAHPPNVTSDISLDIWLKTILSRGWGKGLKLDFKSIEAVEPSLLILEKYSSQLNSSVWLNADVLSGPVNSPTTPVQAEQFLSKCRQYFPNATLSIGWTTDWHPAFERELWQYEWKSARHMADLLKCNGYENTNLKFTFPVRGIFAARSIKKLQWLLSIIPDKSTLTVWSGKYDPLELQDLLRIRSAFPKHKVFYDLPRAIHDKFQEKKNSVDIPNHDLMRDDNQWMTFTRGQGESCSAATYIRNDTILFGKTLTTAVLQKNLVMLDKDPNLKITGRIKYFSYEEGTTLQSSYGTQEVMLLLADISLFTKNISYDSENELDLTTSDTEVVWSAINSSVIYNFQHKYSEETSSCRIFKLDTSADKSFEAWIVPCDTLLEDSSIEEISKSGKSEISSRNRLVLPKGPFMFGIMSSGDEHVAVTELKISGMNENIVSGAKSTIKTPLGFLSVFASLLSLLWML